jgi:hypothetical protein
MPPRKKSQLKIGAIIGAITFIGIVLALLNDALDLSDRLFNRTKETQTIQLVETPSNDLILSTFPYFVGNTWEYSFGILTNGTAERPEQVNETGKYTAKIVNVETFYGGRGRVFYVEVSPPAANYVGFVFNAPCGSKDDSKITYMILTDGKSIYEECDRSKLVEIADKLFSDTENPPPGAVYMLPLMEGAHWPYYSDIPSQDDTFWNWYVEPALDISVPAGTFKDCHKISFRTNPDVTTHFVCAGVGLVASEYHHFGSIVDYRSELISYDFVTVNKP